MQRPICAVVIPTKNCLQYLPIALSSAAAQATGGHEIIVADDGSDDGTDAWLKRRQREWSFLRVIETGGVGPSKARNAAIEAARAPLIAFLDADDWWWPNKLGAQIAYHSGHPEIGFSFTDYLHVSADGESLGSCFEYWKPPLRRRHPTGFFRLNDALSIILATNLVGTSTVVASKFALEKAGGFTVMASAEDWDLWLKLAAQSPAGCSKSITASYLMRPNSLSSQREDRIGAMGGIISAYENSSSPGVRQAAAKARARLDIARAESARAAGRHTSAARYHSRAFMALPSARLGRETSASLLSAALHFVSGHGSSK
jgi:glycosyltransferase involved in cell wall biosynthesis